LAPAEAFAALVGAMDPIGAVESIAVEDAAGRIAAGSTSALRAVPPFNQSAVDGYAVPEAISRDQLPHQLHVTEFAAAGDPSPRALGQGEAMRIATGGVVPSGTAAVVMWEHCDREGRDVLVGRDVEAGANIRRRGEDVAPGDKLLARGMLLNSRHIAMLLAAGIGRVDVAARLRVAVVSTGNEVRRVGTEAADHEIYDANGPALRSLLRAPWLDPIDGGIVRDDTAALAASLKTLATDCDAILTSGGAAGSDTDHTLAAILMASGTARQLQLAQRPGKPLVLGAIGNVPVLGLPGNTVAALVNCMLYGRPMLQRRAGMSPMWRGGRPALAHSTFEHKAGRTYFVPARLVSVAADGRPVLEPLARGGTALLQPFALADGLAELPASSGEISPGDPVLFHSFDALTA